MGKYTLSLTYGSRSFPYYFSTENDMLTAKSMIENHVALTSPKVDVQTIKAPERPKEKNALEEKTSVIMSGYHVFTFDEFDFVDLGLESGTLWATQNVPFGGAGYCPYDMALLLAPGMVPTKKQFVELCKECQWSPKTIDINGTISVVEYTVTGPSGNSIILPVTGYFDSSEGKFLGICVEEKTNTCYGHGEYWSSTKYDVDDAYCFHFDLKDKTPLRMVSQRLSLAVRPVSLRQR